MMVCDEHVELGCAIFFWNFIASKAQSRHSSEPNVVLVQALEAQSDRDKFQAMTPLMLAAIGKALNTNEETSAQEALELFIEVSVTFTPPSNQSSLSFKEGTICCTELCTEPRVIFAEGLPTCSPQAVCLSLGFYKSHAWR